MISWVMGCTGGALSVHSYVECCLLSLVWRCRSISPLSESVSCFLVQHRSCPLGRLHRLVEVLCLLALLSQLVMVLWCGVLMEVFICCVSGLYDVCVGGFIWLLCFGCMVQLVRLGLVLIGYGLSLWVLYLAFKDMVPWWFVICSIVPSLVMYHGNGVT